MERSDHRRGARGLVLSAEPCLTDLLATVRRSGARALGATEPVAAQRAARHLGALEFLLVAGNDEVLRGGASILHAAVRRGDPVMGIVIARSEHGMALHHFRRLPVCSFHDETATTADVLSALRFAVGNARCLIRSQAVSQPVAAHAIAAHAIASAVDDLLDDLSDGHADRRRVLACLVAGLTNKEMIDVLAVDTENQVKKAVRRVLHSIGVTTRTAIVRAYFERVGALESVLAHTRRSHCGSA